MTLRHRITRLERTTRPSEPDIVHFRALYQADDASIDGVWSTASITFGPGQCVFLTQEPDETEAAFEARLGATAQRGPA